MFDNKTPDLGKKELREFGLITGAIIAVLFGLFFPWLFDRGLPVWPWVVFGILAAWALILPMSLQPVYRGWMAIGLVLGWINTRIILGIMFYVMFFPIGMILKVLGKDPMNRELDETKESYRITHSRPNKNHVERPY